MTSWSGYGETYWQESPAVQKGGLPDFHDLRTLEDYQDDEYLDFGSEFERQVLGAQKARLREWFDRRIREAARELDNDIEVDADKCAGVPVVRGTRFKIAQLLSELAEGDDIANLADDLSLDEERLRQILKNISVLIDRPAWK